MTPEFPKRTRLSTGESVRIFPSKSQRRLGFIQASMSGYEIGVRGDLDYDLRTETLIHELIHLAELEMIKSGELSGPLLEDFVEKLGVKLFYYMKHAGMLKGVETPEQLELDL
jgi:hypothetical protein